MLEQEFDAIGARIHAQHAQHAQAPSGDTVALPSLDAARSDFKQRAWRILLVAVAIGAAAAGLFAWWFTQRPGDHPTELEPVALAVNHMLDRLEDAFARLSAFSSELAHDLRAPVHRLMTAAQVALARPRSADEYRALLAASVEDYERIARLIDNILFLARADHAQAGTQPAWVPLAERITAIAEFFDLLAEEHGVRLLWQVEAAEGAPCWADETLMARAIGNLLTNAMRHARPGSTVTLHAHGEPGGACTVEVANEGDPIAPEHQARIFQRRYRLEPPHAATSSGLGLPIVRSVMDLHGGSAGVRSAPGEPTVFTLRFPGPRRRPVDLRPAVR